MVHMVILKITKYVVHNGRRSTKHMLETELFPALGEYSPHSNFRNPLKIKIKCVVSENDKSFVKTVLVGHCAHIKARELLFSGT